MNEQRIFDDIKRLGPWFHNIHLSDTVQTFPHHHFGDFPNWKWQQLASHLPADLPCRFAWLEGSRHRL
jgi:hypothetical protein